MKMPLKPCLMKFSERKISLINSKMITLIKDFLPYKYTAAYIFQFYYDTLLGRLISN